MNTKEITPPNNVRAIFPINGNESKITDAACKYNIAVYPKYRLVMFEGNIKDFHKLRNLLSGGVIA